MDGQHRYSQPQDEVVLVMVPFPAQGHLNQLLHFSHLVISYRLPVHYVGSYTHNRQAKLRLHGWDTQSLNKIRFHDIQLPSYSSPPPNPDSSVHFPVHLQPLFDASLHLRQPVFQLIQQLSLGLKRIVVVHDSLMTSVVHDVKINLTNAETYHFNPTSAFTSFFNSWDALEQKPFSLNNLDVTKSIPSNEGCLTPEVSNLAKHHKDFLGFQSGTLHNTSKVIEGEYIQLLMKLPNNANIKYFAVGPLNPVEIKYKEEEHRHMCLLWLDEQQKDSVLYVAFGSTTSMNDKQILELALGLERSKQKFIWVLRRADIGDVFADSSRQVRKHQLPEEYEERVKNRGLVVKEWAPQLEILAHPSVGGFISHCGWNSCMESISMGVPIAAWPMHSDQPRNAYLVTEVLKTGILVRDWTHRDELVSSTAIDDAVRRLMASEEGQELRKRATELGDAVRASVAIGGVSCSEMDSFISHITR